MIASTAKIHPLSVVEDGAVIGDNVVVGPFCHVGPKVTLADNVELISHVVVLGRTTVGKRLEDFPLSGDWWRFAERSSQRRRYDAADR